MSEVPTCWSCSAPVEDALRCSSCGSLQPPRDASHFSVLGYPERLWLEPDELADRYRSLAREVHPDRYATRPAIEQAYASDHAERLNLAYQALRDPVARIAHVLESNGRREAGRVPLPRELVDEYFDLQAALGALATSEAAERTRLVSRIRPIREKIARLAADRFERLVALARAHDAASEEARGQALEGIEHALGEYRYLRSMLRDLDRKLMDAGVA